MIPGREIFWNIEFGEIIYLLAVIATGLLIYALYQYYRRWRLGRPADRFNQWRRRVRDFVTIGIVDGLLHRKFFGVTGGLGHGTGLRRALTPQEFYPGLVHFLIFTGAIVLFLGSFLDFISHYFFHFLQGTFYLGYSVVTDSFGILIIIGVILALLRRYIQKPERLDNRLDDLVILLLILTVVVTGFVVEGLRLAVTELETAPDWAPWSPGGYVCALALKGLSDGALLTMHVAAWWLHALLSLGAIVYVSLYYSKLLHIVWGPINVFFRKLGPPGALVPIELETAEIFGATKIEDFTWKQLLDLDACTRCGRCQDNCPAYLSGKGLSPKKLIRDLKTHFSQVYPKATTGKPAESRQDMITQAVTEEVIWDCTTCRACEQVCPVYIEHIDKIIDMRRNLAMERAQLPGSVREVLTSLETRGHPWRGTTATRTDWAAGLGVRLISEDSDIELLYWVGCTAALEDRNIKVAQAMAQILQAAGINFGILGIEENCCGDPARRMGNEYLFQILCENNIELLQSYNVRKILTTCPHCFNTLKNEYPQFGGNFEVIHHTQLIAELIRGGSLNLSNLESWKVAYHDSCYLGRYNNIYREPREALQALGGVKMVELPRRGPTSFCCGGGGGHIWMEEDPDKRVNLRRVNDIIEAKIDIVATACPYCVCMLEDGLKAKEAEGFTKVMDVSELVADAIRSSFS